MDKPEFVLRMLLFLAVGLAFLLALRKSVMGRAVPLPSATGGQVKIVYILFKALDAILSNFRPLMIAAAPFILLVAGLNLAADRYLEYHAGAHARGEAPVFDEYARVLFGAFLYAWSFLAGLFILFAVGIMLQSLRRFFRFGVWRLLIWILFAAYLGAFLSAVDIVASRANLVWLFRPDPWTAEAVLQDWSLWWANFGLALLGFLIFGLPLLLVPAAIAGVPRPFRISRQLFRAIGLSLLVAALIILSTYQMLADSVLRDLARAAGEFSTYDGGEARTWWTGTLLPLLQEYAFNVLRVAISYIAYILLAGLIAAAFVRERGEDPEFVPEAALG